jgi:hypothetical protein
MKKIKLLLLAIIVTTTFSCSSNDDNSSTQDLYEISFIGNTHITQPLAGNQYTVTAKYLSGTEISHTEIIPITNQELQISHSKNLEKNHLLGIQIEVFGIYDNPEYSYMWTDDITVKIKKVSTNEVVLEEVLSYLNTDAGSTIKLLYNTDDNSHTAVYVN